MKRIYISKYPGSTSNLNYKFILLTFCLVGNKPQFRKVKQNPIFFRKYISGLWKLLPSQSFAIRMARSQTLVINNLLVTRRGVDLATELGVATAPQVIVQHGPMHDHTMSIPRPIKLS